MANFIVGIINALIQGLADVLNAVFSLLPNSPFALIDNSPIAPYLSGLNWLIPISSLLGILEAWLTCIALYYIYSIVLRWIKAIKG